MLSGAQLAIAITAILLGAIALGWILHWIWVRLSNAAITDTARITEMINRLHEADRAREAAEDARELAENLLASREGALEGREAELTRQLREAQADAEASMSGLRSARARAMELELELEKVQARLDELEQPKE